MSAGSGSKFWRCFPCVPAKQNPTPDPNLTTTGIQDEQDLSFWQDGARAYSRRQICKGVAIVLSGYDLNAAAGAIDPTCDPNTVNLWVQLYKPPFFEDGMLCPPALIMWWMNELDRKNKLTQGQTLQQQGQGYGPPMSTSPIGYNGPMGQSGGGPLGQPPNSSTFGTSYLKVPFITPDGTIVNQTITTAGAGNNPNSIVISSPSASQPNVRVFYQDDQTRVPVTGQYIPSGGLSPVALSQQRPNSVPQTAQPVSYDILGRPFQSQLTRVQAQQQKEAEDALNALQAQIQNQAARQGQIQGQGQTQGQGQIQSSGQGQSPGQRFGQLQGQGQSQNQGQGQGQNQPQGLGQNQGQGQNQPQGLGQNQGQGQNQPQGQGQIQGQGPNQPQGQGQGSSRFGRGPPYQLLN